MEPVKVIIFVAFFALFLIVVRKFFSSESPNPANVMPVPYPEMPREEEKEAPVLVGADLPFPILLPPRVQRQDGTYNRPEIENYFFRKLDLVRGPEDRKSFCDEFTIQFVSPEENHKWFLRYTVATPAGMQTFLNFRNPEGFMLNEPVIIVPKWDMGAVLKIIMDELMEAWAAPEEQGKSVYDPREIPE